VRALIENSMLMDNFSSHARDSKIFLIINGLLVPVSPLTIT